MESLNTTFSYFKFPNIGMHHNYSGMDMRMRKSDDSSAYMRQWIYHDVQIWYRISVSDLTPEEKKLYLMLMDIIVQDPMDESDETYSNKEYQGDGERGDRHIPRNQLYFSSFELKKYFPSKIIKV